MTDYPKIKIRKGREGSSRYRHPWIFSGAVVRVPKDLFDGDPVLVEDCEGRVLGTGTYSARSQISVRLFAFEEAVLDGEFIRRRIQEADARRLLSGLGPDTADTGYRVVFGESDLLPGLVIDRYNDVFVIQSATAGMDKLCPLVLKALEELFRPRLIVERSDLHTRIEEGILPGTGIVGGADKKSDAVGAANFSQLGLNFISPTLTGQKTGFFLDQRDLRSAIARLSAGRKALNLFSYSGAHGLFALAGGAKSVLNLDSSAPALEMCSEHARMNGFPAESMICEKADVFDWLTNPPQTRFDMVICDPPALIKSSKHMDAGLAAYRFLNRAAISLLAPGGIFVASSCSHHLSSADFAHVLRQTSVHESRPLHTLGFIGQAEDHPVSLYFPEAAYLKSFVFQG